MTEFGDRDEPMLHGATEPLTLRDAALFAEDPDMWLVVGDMATWSKAHPCECEALCRCDAQQRPTTATD